MVFTVVRSDIVEASADAVVNAAETSLRRGSGVAGALHRGANPDQRGGDGPRPRRSGGVAVTDA